MSNILDIEFDPKPGVNEHTITPPRTLRVYESSIRGAVSFYTRGDGFEMGRGLRLDRDQVTELHAALGTYLAETSA